MPKSQSAAVIFPSEVELDDPNLGTTLQKVSYSLARSIFSSDAEMALAFGVDRSNMARWKAGAPLSAINLSRLVAFDVVVSLLVGFLSPTTIPKWLRSTNAHLSNRRPIDVLLAGKLSDVVAAIENEKTGAFA